MRRRGIIVGGMILSLLLGCNNGGEDPQKVFLKSVVSLGNDFLNVFTSFGDTFGNMFSETLGFKADSSKKEDVGKYFKNIENNLTKTKTALEKIVTEMKKESNPNAEATDVVVKSLITDTLDKIIDGAKTVNKVIGDDNSLIADFGTKGVGAAGDSKVVQSITEGIKKIVDVVLKEKGDPEAGTIKKADDLGDRTYNVTGAEAGKLFATSAIDSSHEKKAAADAVKAVGAVTGADILKAIANNNDSAKLAKETNGNTAGNAPKDGTIAGAIALRAIAKDSKFANKN